MISPTVDARNRSPASLHYQRGAIGLFATLTLLLALLFTALTVDTGRLYMEQRRLQKIADMAAMDAATALIFSDESEQAAVQAEAEDSAIRNGLPDATGEVEVVLGNVDVFDGIRRFISGSDFPMAVQVTTHNTVPASFFAGGILGRTVNLSAVAVARRQLLAGIWGGSGLLELNSQQQQDRANVLNALLNGILGSNLNLDLVSYQGIASTEISLMDLVEADIEIGTVSELLKADLTVGELLDLFLETVNASGVADAEIVLGALQTIIDANVSNLGIKLGDVLHLQTPTQMAAAQADISLLDLLTTSLIVANGDHAIELPLNFNLLGLTVGSRLEVIEPPQIAIGPPGKDAHGNWRTRIDTAQVRLDIGIEGGGLLTSLGLADVDLGVHLEVARGQAWLKDVQRVDADHYEVVIGAQSSAIDGLRVSNADDSGAGRITLVSLLGLDLARVDVLLPPRTDYSSSREDLTFDVIDGEAQPPMRTVSSTLSGELNGNLGTLGQEDFELDVSLLGGLLNLGLGDILGPVVGEVLQPILGELTRILVDPLLDILGTGLGTLDVRPYPKPQLGPPELVI